MSAQLHESVIGLVGRSDGVWGRGERGRLLRSGRKSLVEVEVWGAMEIRGKRVCIVRPGGSRADLGGYVGR